MDLDVGGTQLNSLRGLLGGRLTRRLDFGDGLPVGVSFRAIWMHEFLRQTAGLVDAEFDALPGAGFAIRGLDLGRDWAVMGPGITWAIRDRVSLFANYDVQFNAAEVYHVGSGGVEITW